MLPVQQSLSGTRILQVGETVVALHVPQTRRIHLASEPLAAIDPNLDREREPTLHPHMAAAEDPVLEVEKCRHFRNSTLGRSRPFSRSNRTVVAMQGSTAANTPIKPSSMRFCAAIWRANSNLLTPALGRYR
jgi:hypothetical protein